MARQLRHLAEAGQAPHVSLRVLPFALGGHTGLDGAFTVLEFARNNPVVHLEHKISGVFLEQPDEVALFKQEAGRLDALALNLAESSTSLPRSRPSTTESE
jgi:Domain of unknown function (DUF5753)